MLTSTPSSCHFWPFVLRSLLMGLPTLCIIPSPWPGLALPLEFLHFSKTRPPWYPISLVSQQPITFIIVIWLIVFFLLPYPSGRHHVSLVDFCILKSKMIPTTLLYLLNEWMNPQTCRSLNIFASLWHSLQFLHPCLYPKNITVPHTRHQHRIYHHLLIHSHFLDVRISCCPQHQC